MVDKAIQSHDTENRTPVKADRHQTWTPPVDVLETKNEVLLIADVPGVSADGLDIQIENGLLTIEARVEKRHESDPAYLLREHGANVFARSFNVGDGVNTEAITAEIRDGRLTLHLPKAEAAKPRRIDVKTA